ncbi:hypothetical protein [Beijerinckia sp. L45]|uniref:hypothetical protein n=1 Tax=Beijerinckia sp. L45 TaxID=1641855 RepID=UPI00131E0A0A|nr:hypothetical protein [Beijerinckia sp. L45]
MSTPLIAAPVKETVVSVSVTIGVSAAALATVVAVAMIASRADGRYQQPLQMTAFAGEVATVWSDVFDFSDEPRTFIASMRRMAEADVRQFKVGKIAILVSTLRADSRKPCQPLVTYSGETPARWDQSLCPLRAQVTDTETMKTLVVEGTACMPPYASDDRSQTMAVIDVHAGTLSLSTTRDGHPEPACERTVHLPTPSAQLSGM